MATLGDRIQFTASTALTCKWSAATCGYWQDPFIDDFTLPNEKHRQSPFMNRAYYGRVIALQALLNSALSQACVRKAGRVQLLSLGAGLDTTAFRLLHENADQNLVVYEVDQKEVVECKRQLISSSAAIQNKFGWATEGDQDEGTFPRNNPVLINHPNYKLIAGDLHSFKEIWPVLQETGFDWRLPTIIFIECVLTYVDPDTTTALFNSLGSLLEKSLVVLYERIGKAEDAVSQKITEVLQKRGVGLQSLPTFADTDDWANLLRCSGWNHAIAWDLNSAVCQCIDYNDILRISNLEPFDEYASLAIFQAHYCIAVGSTTSFCQCLPIHTNPKVEDLSVRFTRLESSIHTLSNRMDSLEAALISTATSCHNVLIREFEAQDTQPVRDLIRQSLLEEHDHPSVKKFVKNTMKRQLGDITRDFIGEDKEKGRLWVACEEKTRQVVGCIGLVFIPGTNESELKHLAVHSDFRRQGIASSLIRTLEQYCCSTGVQKIILTTLKTMDAANSFYQRLNYTKMLEEEKKIPTYHQPKSSFVEMISYYKFLIS